MNNLKAAIQGLSPILRFLKTLICIFGVFMIVLYYRRFCVFV